MNPETCTRRIVATVAGVMLATHLAAPGWAASLNGRVVGTPPEAPTLPIRMGTDPFCHHAHATPVQRPGEAIREDGAVRWAFVYVKSGLEDRDFPPPVDPVILDQAGCMYVPHVFGVRAGQPIHVRNSDQTVHNVRGIPHHAKPFNLAHPPIPGLEHELRFDEPDIMVHFKCDVHPWMSAYAGVVAHPFFAVTDADGAFRIDGLPPGSYTVAVWHETLGEVERRVHIETEEEEQSVDFSFTAAP